MDKSLPQRDLPFAPSELHPGARKAGVRKQMIFGGRGGSGTKVRRGCPFQSELQGQCPSGQIPTEEIIVSSAKQ